MDKGRAVATGTKEELKAMIRTGEKVTIEAMGVNLEQLAQIRSMPDVLCADYSEGILTASCGVESHGFLDIVSYLKEEEIRLGKVFSEPPTLNDVFLEITGKELRD